MDQAEELRKLVRKNISRTDTNNKCRIVTVSGGKGGVGKTSVTANMALVLAEYGLRVGIFDADMGLANIDIMLGVSPKKNLANVVLNGESLENILVEGPRKIKIIPASSGVEELSHLSDNSWNSLIEQLNSVYKQFDVLLVDTAAGIGKNVINFVLASQELILVTTPDPTALADTYAMVKIIDRKTHSRKVDLLVNQSDNKRESLETYNRIEKLITNNLSIHPNFLGWIPRDDCFKKAIRARRGVVSMEPSSPSSKAIYSLSKKWYENTPPYGSTGNVKIYLGRIKNLMKKHEKTRIK